MTLKPELLSACVAASAFPGAAPLSLASPRTAMATSPKSAARLNPAKNLRRENLEAPGELQKQSTHTE